MGLNWLLTSGGTRIRIDPVRHITNMSHGTFGSRIAHEILYQGDTLTFIRAKGSLSPFSVTCDARRDSFEDSVARLLDAHRGLKYFEKYNEIEFDTFQDYADRLEAAIRVTKPDIVVLAAAVSDYGVENPHEAKIRSNDALTIQLAPLPKLISKIKEWCQTTTLVGFKLLVSATKDELIEAANKSIETNGCDLVIANDLESIRNENHTIHIVRKCHDGEYQVETHDSQEDPDNPHYLAGVVMMRAGMYHRLWKAREQRENIARING